MVVRELVALLGLKVSDAGFKAADKLIDGAKSGLSAMGEAADKFASNAAKNFPQIATAAAVTAGVIGGMLSAAVHGIITSVVEMNNHLGKTAPQMGMTVQGLQGLEYAGKTAGVSAESLGAAWDHLQEQFKAAGLGSAHAAIAIGGLSKAGADGKLKSFGEQLEAVREKVMKYEDPIKRATEAQRYLGASGKDILPLFEKGPGYIKLMTEELALFGATVTGEDIQASKKFGLEMARLGGVAQGFKQTVARPIIDAWNSASQAFSDWVKKQNGADLAKAQQGFSQFNKAGALLELTLKAIYKGAALVAEHIDLITIALGAVIATGFAVWLGGLVIAFVSGGALALAAWLPMVAFFAALLLIIDDVNAMLQGGDSLIEDFFPNLAKEIREIAKLVEEGKFEKAWEKAGWAIQKFLDRTIFSWALQQIDELVDAIKAIPGRVVGGIGKAIKDPFGTYIEGQKPTLAAAERAKDEDARRELAGRRAGPADSDQERETQMAAHQFQAAIERVIANGRIAAMPGPSEGPAMPIGSYPAFPGGFAPWNPGGMNSPGQGPLSNEHATYQVSISVPPQSDPELTAQAMKKQFDTWHEEKTAKK